MLKIRVISVTKKELLKDLNAHWNSTNRRCSRKLRRRIRHVRRRAVRRVDRRLRVSAITRRICAARKHFAGRRGRARPVLERGFVGNVRWDEFREMTEVRDIRRFSTARNTRNGASFRESEDSRYVGLTLPHVLGRVPTARRRNRPKRFNFEEDVDGTDHKKYLWSNAAYAMARADRSVFDARLVRAIRGVEGGGLVDGLPTHTFETDEGEVAMKCPTEVAITDRREKNSPTTDSFRSSIAKARITRRSSPRSRATRRKNTIRMRRTPTRVSRRSCSTFSPFHVSRTI
jgi:type VI secretion system protein ImpC